jgi:D-alanyl-D-alanine carboxypeptidase
MLVSSNNSASRMIVDGMEKNESKFVTEMNTYANTLGLKKTKFTDPSGADLGNISTAREYLKIFQDAVKNDTILSTLGMKSYTYDELIDKDDNPTHFDSHTNELTKRSNLPYTIVASKTGYLIESGSGLAMLVERKSDHKQFFVISMGNPEYDQRFDDVDTLTRWALKNF